MPSEWIQDQNMELTLWKISFYNMFQNQDLDTLNVKYAKCLLHLIPLGLETSTKTSYVQPQQYKTHLNQYKQLSLSIP